MVNLLSLAAYLSSLLIIAKASDLRFLNSELRLAGAGELKDIIVVDILKMARRLLPGLQRYALWFVADKLGIKAEQEHRAFSHVELTRGVFNRIKDMLGQKGVIDFRNFVGLFGFKCAWLEDADNQKIAEI